MIDHVLHVRTFVVESCTFFAALVVVVVFFNYCNAKLAHADNVKGEKYLFYIYLDTHTHAYNT